MSSVINKEFAQNIINYITNPGISKFQKIEQIIEYIYESEINDINDLSNCVYIINYYIKECIRNKKNYYELPKLRLYAHKMIKRKFREGYEFLHEDEIVNQITKSKIKYPEEQSKNYKNVQDCVIQFELYKKLIWNPSIIELINLENKSNLRI